MKKNIMQSNIKKIITNQFNVNNIQEGYIAQQCVLSYHNKKMSIDGIQYIINNPWRLTMKQIWLWCDNINDEGLKLLSMVEWQNLIKLNLNDNKFTGKGINYLIRNKWDCLEELDLSNNKINNFGIQNLIKHKWPKLTSLGLNKCQLSIDAVVNLLYIGKWNLLTTLFLNFNKVQSFAVIKAMAGKGSAPQLSNLVLRYNGINIIYWPIFGHILPKGWNIY